VDKFREWDLQKDIHQYECYAEKCTNVTPYHLVEYLLAEEKAEEGWTKIFLYEDNGKFALLPQVVRKINSLPYMQELEKNEYDMIAPHEYGGIIGNTNERAVMRGLLENILAYCKANHIIFQFIRINPYMKELPFIYEENGYELIHSNSHVYVNLKQTEEQIIGDYKSNVRRNVKRAEKEGLTFKIAEKTHINANIFKELYQKAMEILEARRFLYFNDEYFQALIKCNCSRLGIVQNQEGKIIAAAVMLLDEDIVYYHLGCFDRDYKLQRPMNYLMHSMILWSKRNGYRTFHLAGGSKSLMQFKTGYSSTRVDYYIANQICDKKRYNNICSMWKSKFPEFADEQYYPLYRYNE